MITLDYYYFFFFFLSKVENKIHTLICFYSFLFVFSTHTGLINNLLSRDDKPASCLQNPTKHTQFKKKVHPKNVTASSNAKCVYYYLY